MSVEILSAITVIAICLVLYYKDFLVRWVRSIYTRMNAGRFISTRLGKIIAFSSSLAGVQVKDLEALVDSQNGAVTVSWLPPLAVPGRPLITRYEIRFKQAGTFGWLNSPPERTLWTDANTEPWIVITREKGLKPLNLYVFDVRPVSSSGAVGKWSSITRFVDWHCRLPFCGKNRLKKPSGTVYDFCSRDHYKEFAVSFCLYPECCIPKTADGDFCACHMRIAINDGFAAIVELEPETSEFASLDDMFRKNWSKDKGPCPRITAILRIINPALYERYLKYHSQLSWWYQGKKQYYHGTKLSCNITEYLELCNSDSCGICGISQQGFDPSRISRNRWQRFGGGFYLAPNSSKSHDYPLRGRNSSLPSGTGMRGLLLCDVAPGRSYTLRRSDPNLQGPPKGYDSVYGKSKFLGLFGDLNYDEIVIFNPHAVFPHYIILY